MSAGIPKRVFRVAIERPGAEDDPEIALSPLPKGSMIVRSYLMRLDPERPPGPQVASMVFLDEFRVVSVEFVPDPCLAVVSVP